MQVVHAFSASVERRIFFGLVNGLYVILHSFYDRLKIKAILKFAEIYFLNNIFLGRQTIK